MSISNLLVPNNYDLQAASITLEGGSILDEYEEGSLNVSFIGPFASPVAVIVNYRKINQNVTLYIPSVLAARNSDAAITNTGTEIPSNLRPTSTSNALCAVFVNNAITNVPGFITVNSAGVITISATISSPNFTGVGTVGLQGVTSISYNTLI